MRTLGCNFNPDQTGLFLWGCIPEKVKSCEAFTEKLLQKTHVFITPGFIFGKNGDRYVRISLCLDEEKLMKAKNRVVNFV
jgi:hypothetical protein